MEVTGEVQGGDGTDEHSYVLNGELIFIESLPSKGSPLPWPQPFEVGIMISFLQGRNLRLRKVK